VHLSNLEQVGVDALRRAIRQPEVLVVVIDEIGKMELILGWLQQDQGESARRATCDGENAPLDA
jgi:nucleoside-triphosphatase THEP1